MSSTATNKQPLLIDRPLHVVYDLDKAITGVASSGSVNIIGTNTAIACVNAIGTDGAILEDIYCWNRSTTQQWINLYFSNEADFLRSTAIFIGRFQSSNSAAPSKTDYGDMPNITAPVPQVSVAQFKALYVPAGTCLWAARHDTAEVTNGPILGFQGGWY